MWTNDGDVVENNILFPRWIASEKEDRMCINL